MSTESFATIMIILICWIILLALDAVVCGILHLCMGISFRKAFLWGMLSLLLPPIAVLYGGTVGRNLFKIEEVEIAFERLPEGFDGYRIVHISDIHARSFAGREKQLRKAVEMINRLSPDLVAFTGDLITMGPDEMDCCFVPLSSLQAKDGVVSVLGNHDYCIYSATDSTTRTEWQERLIETERKMGWDLLIDENRTIRRGCDSIAVIGVQNTSPSRHFPSKGDLDKASKGTEGSFRILLSHDPMHWDDEIIGQDYPLTLSGHTHGMQLSLLGWSPSSLIFDRNKGLYTEGDQHLYVNIGLGETIFPARIGARPEITLITLTGK